MKLWRNLFFGVLVSAVFLWLALRDVQWGEVQGVLQRVRWEYAPLVLAVWWLALAARAARWYALMDGRVGLQRVFHIYNVGFFINATLPFRVGELARAYLVSQEKAEVSGWAALSTILTERVLDVLAVVVILLLILPALPLEAAVISGGLLVGAAAVLAFAVLLVAARFPAWIHAVLRAVLRVMPVLARLNPITLADRVLDGLKPLSSWRGLLRIGFWTAVVWLLSVLEVWSLVLIFPDWPQTGAAYTGLALALVAASLSIIIPFTPAGVGPFEAAVIFALTSTGIPAELRVTYAVVWHTGLVLFFGMWGVIGLLVMGLSLGQVWRGASVYTAKQPTGAEGSQT